MATFQGWFVRVALTLPLYLVTMVLLHEAGHAVTAAYFTTGQVRVHVWPGYELYPNVGYALAEPWPEGIPAMTMVTPVAPISVVNGKISFPPFIATRNQMFEMRRHESLVKLMGSTTTLLFGLLSLVLISLCKPDGPALWLLSAGSLLHPDMLTYTIFPTFFGARHLIWIGGVLPEPVEVLSGLGLSNVFTITAIVSLSLLQLGWLYHLLTTNRIRRDVFNKQRNI